MSKVPRDLNDNYSDDIIKKRREFITEQAPMELKHLASYSFDPHSTQGNVENFIGVAQIPIGVAGPLVIHGEYAQGAFVVPLATTEGTLVASYNRGMKLLNMSGGVRTSVFEDQMQRAPVFTFDSAREARDFAHWIENHFDKIKEIADSTSRVGRLKSIERYQAHKYLFLRFNYTTGDAAGQNMVGKATYAACLWIVENYPHIRHYFLESNFATDKKGSMVNIMKTRGKRVTAEAVIPRAVLIETMRTDPETLDLHFRVANIGGFLSGVNNNGAHSANGITAMFIATGQDVANVAESSAGLLCVEITPERDLYIAITIPSLIVATYGGGTGLPTQRECLEILGCYGRDKVYKLAEIVAGVVLAGELSLGSAISSQDWVSSHERYGRNR